MKEIFVIKNLDNQKYLTDDSKCQQLWSRQVRLAANFKTYPEAVNNLNNPEIESGNYQIEKIFRKKEMENKKYTYRFTFKNEKGILDNRLVTVNKKDSEEAIAEFESIHDSVVWRTVEFMEEV